MYKNNKSLVNRPDYCIHNQRLAVSAAFFTEIEFQQTGFKRSIRKGICRPDCLTVISERAAFGAASSRNRTRISPGTSAAIFSYFR